jgi:hypothetical protein
MTLGDLLRDIPLSAKVGTTFRRQVAVVGIVRLWTKGHGFFFVRRVFCKDLHYEVLLNLPNGSQEMANFWLSSSNS